MSELFVRWAIDTCEPTGRFIGRYWSESGWPPVHHPLPTRLFETRREARDFLRKMKDKGTNWYQAFPKARVARVQVEVRVIP